MGTLPSTSLFIPLMDETFDGNEGKTGFTITQTDEENYLSTLADYMHGLGLAWIAKNLDDTERASFVDAMEPLAQGIISEQCNQYHTCSYLHPFLVTVGNAQYSMELSRFCPSDNAADMNGILFNKNLDGGRSPADERSRPDDGSRAQLVAPR